jgi:hypothetical protein
MLASVRGRPRRMGAAEQNAADRQREADAVALKRIASDSKTLSKRWPFTGDRERLQKDLEAIGITPERIKTGEGLRDALKEASDTESFWVKPSRSLRTINGDGGCCYGSSLRPRRCASGVGPDMAHPEDNAPWCNRSSASYRQRCTVIGGAVGFWRRYSPKLKPIVEAVARIKEERVPRAKSKRPSRNGRAGCAA